MEGGVAGHSHHFSIRGKSNERPRPFLWEGDCPQELGGLMQIVANCVCVCVCAWVCVWVCVCGCVCVCVCVEQYML